MMPETNLTEDRTQTKAFVDFRCSPSVVGGLQPQSIYFSAVYILLSITTFLGNSLILVALHKESALHAPSKLLYRCLATTDLLVGIFSQPIMATYWMLVVQENWSRCRYAGDAAFILGYTLYGVSLSTMTAISVDRLLALMLGLRYKQIVTLKRTYLIVVTFFGYLKFFWAVVYFKLPYNLMAWPCKHIKHITSSANLNHLVHKDFSYSQSSSGWSTTSCSTTAEPTKCIEHGEIQKSTIQCTVGADCISCLLFTIRYNGNFYQP